MENIEDIWELQSRDLCGEDDEEGEGQNIKCTNLIAWNLMEFEPV